MEERIGITAINMIKKGFTLEDKSMADDLTKD